MKTIGEILREQRIQKGYSISVLEKATKIKRNFLYAIEKEDWDNLPEFTVVSGFVRNISSFLGLDEGKTTAVLRRDYPPKKLRINPKPDVSKKFVWSPRLTFIAGVAVVTLMILGYLGFQYSDFVSAPNLEVLQPGEGEIVKVSSVKVVGVTDADTSVTVNNQPVLVEEDGNFEVEIAVSTNTQEIVVKAKSRSGKMTEVVRKVEIKQEN